MNFIWTQKSLTLPINELMLLNLKLSSLKVILREVRYLQCVLIETLFFTGKSFHSLT